MNRNRIQKRILSVILTAALLFSGTDYGNLSVVSAQEGSTEGTLLVEETDSSPADGGAQEDAEDADSAAVNDEDTVLEETDLAEAESISTSTDNAKEAETDTADTDTGNTESSDIDAAEETDAAAEETAAEKIQTINAAESDAEAESDEIEETEEEEEEKRVNAADSGTCGDNIQWIVENNVLKITGSGRINDYTPNSGLEPAPWAKFGYDKIEIGAGVTYIGSYAFEQCKVKEISIANTVTEIGEGAFYSYGADDDTEYSIVLPESVQQIGLAAFKDSFFKTITIQSPVRIGGSAFEHLHKLETIDVTYSDDAVVAASTFKYSQLLKTVILRGNISEIEACAFLDCSALETIEIPNATPDIEDCEAGYSPFEGCASLKAIKIPNGFKNIGNNAFNIEDSRVDLSCINNIKLSDSTERIGESAFGQCKELTNITIPKSVTTIGQGAFMSSGLETVTFEAREEGAKLTIGSDAFGSTNLSMIEIPDGSTVEIGAFRSISDSLKKAVVGDDVVLERESFAYNPELEEIIIGTNVTIGERAFALSNSFGGNTDVRVVIGERCSLGMHAFRDRITLSEVEIGKDVTIPDGNDPFSQCYTEDTVFKLYKGSEADAYAKENNFKNMKYFVQQTRFLPDADNKDPREIVKGAASQLELELLPDLEETGAENDGIATIAKSIKWETSDGSVVTIGSDAPTTAENKAAVTIQAVGKGTCTITATCDGEIQAACDITVLEPAAAVTADPGDGAVIYSNTEENAVALACDTQGAVIYYTTDGSEPTKSSPRYEHPITFDGSIDSVTVKAFAAAEGYADSEVSTLTYTVKKKAEGIVLNEESLTLGKDEARTLSVRFTPDGAESETASVAWRSDNEEVASVQADNTNSLRVVVTAKKEGTCTITAACGEFTASCEVTVTSVPRVSQVTADPESGEVESGKEVSLNCATPGAAIYYTTDGTEPTEESTRYENRIVVDRAMTIQAIAVKNGYDNSVVAAFEYTIKKAEEAELEGISLDKNTMTLGLTETGTLQVSFQPENAAPAEVTWESSDTTVVQVEADAENSARAQITGVNAGTSTITASCGKFTATCEVTVTAEGEEQKQVTAVKADPVAGEVSSGTKISLTCDTEGAEIYYTLDGTTPTKESTSYSGEITVNEAVTIKAVAVKEGLKDSEVSTFVYTVKNDEETPIETPVTDISLDRTSMELGLEETGRLTASFQPSQAKPQAVQWISDNPEVADVTADTEDFASAMVTARKEGTCTITVSFGTVTAVCKVTVKGVKRVSAIIAKPSDEFAVTPGTEVTLHCDTKGASIYYTLDGTAPTAAGTLYTGAIMLNADTAIRAVAVKEGYEDSQSASFCYTVNDFVPDLPEIEKPQEGIWITEVKDQPYTGSALKPTVYVYDGKKLLKEKTDYTISYKNNKNPGTGQIIISGKGNYTDKKTVSFQIVEKNIYDKDVIIEDMAYAYDKRAHKTAPVITHNGKKLKAGKDFEVIYSEGGYTEAGSYELTIKGIGNYTGTAKGVIKIVEKENLLSKAAVAAIPAQQYDKGREITLPETVLKVTLRGQTLKIDKDYEVSYDNHVNPGKATVIIKGIGAYAGTKKATFKIVRTAVDINEAVCVNANSLRSMEFVKGGCTPCPVLVCDGDTLREGTDYTVSYKNNKKSGAAASLTVRGKGNYKGKKEIRFEIRNKDISNVSMYTPNVPYTGKANKYQSKPILADSDGTRLKAGTDYTLAYTVDGAALDKRSNPAENTVITVQVVGKGNYSGSRTDTYVLKGTSFTAARISIQNKNYTGMAVTIDAEDIKSAAIKTKNGMVPLTYGVDYEVVSYSKNIKKGTATVVLCGIGEYSGEKSVKFKIVNKKMSAN
ncbi:MAG: chitobiase/beta-hexosaminidase C-terminal domain-containing protein [Lachnospiraceae bacterium]|nr:chitobiase/beta-hexosaminidase C-terminal domain-containing protein [Lachnospiraceae bacterium]